jgi:hypothetical protein
MSKNVNQKILIYATFSWLTNITFRQRDTNPLPTTCRGAPLKNVPMDSGSLHGYLETLGHYVS